MRQTRPYQRALLTNIPNRIERQKLKSRMIYQDLTDELGSLTVDHVDASFSLTLTIKMQKLHFDGYSDLNRKAT